MSHSAVSLVLKGRVQGVFFRASTQSRAEELNLTGWVCNRHDGSVEIYAEGNKEKLKDLIAWCRQGPPVADVTDVIVNWVAPEGLKEFIIRHR